LHESLGILPPVGLIEVSRQKVAAVIAQERIDADGLVPGQVVIDHPIGHGQQLALVLWDRVFLDTKLGVERLPMR